MSGRRDRAGGRDVLPPYLMIPSTVTAAECAELVRLAEGKTVLELGSYLGRSTVALAQAAGVVHSVDWHRGDPHSGVTDSLFPFLRNTEPYRGSGRIVAHVGRFEAVLPLLAPAVFDLVFIDGFHERAAVEADVDRVLPLLRRPGVIAFHDYGRFGVAPAVDAFVERTGSRIRLIETLAVGSVP